MKTRTCPGPRLCVRCSEFRHWKNSVYDFAFDTVAVAVYLDCDDGGGECGGDDDDEVGCRSSLSLRRSTFWATLRIFVFSAMSPYDNV